MVGMVPAARGISSRSHARGVTARPPRGANALGPRARIKWDRLGRYVLVIAIGVVLVSYIHPLTTYLSQYKAANRARAELDRLKQQNRQLHLRIKEQSDPLTVELRARRLGMARQGERPYIIEGLK